MKQLKKYFFTYLIFLPISSSALPQNIILRPALETDLPSLFKLDRIVAFEYFKPLYMHGYSPLPIGQNPDHFIELELELDKTWFPACICNKTDDFFAVAYDTNINKVVGLIIVHKDTPTTLEIDLFLIQKEYRKKGIGRALVHNVLNNFPEITTCAVYPFKFANSDTLSFYQSLGFVDTKMPKKENVTMYGMKYSDLCLYLRKQII